jgi:hypothetical protein
MRQDLSLSWGNKLSFSKEKREKCVKTLEKRKNVCYNGRD